MFLADNQGFEGPEPDAGSLGQSSFGRCECFEEDVEQICDKACRLKQMKVSIENNIFGTTDIVVRTESAEVRIRI